MTIIKIFLQFTMRIMSIKLLGLNLMTWLIIFTIFIFAFRIIYEIVGIRKKRNKEKSDKND